jgi:plastocyanin
MRMKGITAAALLLLAGLMLGAVACSSGEPADPTPVTKFKITPASGTQPASATAAATKPAGTPTAAGTPSVAGTPTAAAGTPTAASGTPAAGGSPSTGGTSLTITASNTLFDKSTLTASPGAVKIIFENKDGGLPHNFHLYLGKDTTGKDMGMTPINVGPAKDELDVTLEAGSYYFQCDVHVATMSGTLTVK